MQCCNLSNYDY